MRGVLRFVAVLIVALVACGGGGGKASVSSSAATLKIRDANAQAKTKAAAQFVAAVDGQKLALGDAVKTDTTGFAQVNYNDGSLTRIDSNGSFTVTDLSNANQTQRVVGSLDGGRAWSKVEKITSSEGRYEIDTDVANASVRGTQFDVDCRAPASCTFTVATGTVGVTPKGGTEVSLTAGQSVIVHSDGSTERPDDQTPDQLKADPWIAQNLALDSGDESKGQSSAGVRNDDVVGTYVASTTVSDGNASHPVGETSSVTFTITCSGTPCALTSPEQSNIALSGNELRSSRSVPEECPAGAGTGAITDRIVTALRVTEYGQVNGRPVPTKLEGSQTVTSDIPSTCGATSDPVTTQWTVVRQP